MYEAVILNGAELTYLYRESAPDCVLISDTLTESSVNYKTWEFTIPTNNPCYDKIEPFKTRVIITDLKTREYIFNGRAVVVNKQMSENGDITESVQCEDIELYLDDSEQAELKYKGTPKEFLKILIDRHNTQVEEYKRFDIGTIEIDLDRKTFYVPVEWETLPILNQDGEIVGETIAGNKALAIGDTATVKSTAVYYNSYYHGEGVKIAEFVKGRKHTVQTVDSERNTYRLYYGTTPIGWVDGKDIVEASETFDLSGYTGETKPVVYTSQRNETFEVSSGTPTLDAIRQLLLDPFGGYLIVDYHEANPRINIIYEPGKDSTQVIQLAVNMMSINADFDPSDLYSVCRPIGTPIDNGGVDNGI